MKNCNEQNRQYAINIMQRDIVAGLEEVFGKIDVFGEGFGVEYKGKIVFPVPDS